MILRITKKILLIALFSGQCFFVPLQVSAEENATKACVGGACFKKAITVDGQKLVLNGTSLFRYYGFRVYSAAFYSEEKVNSVGEALAPKSKYLVLHYHRSLDKSDIIKNSNYILKKNPKVAFQKQEKKLEKLYEYFSDVKDGDRFALAYRDKTGLTLFFNEQEKVSIEGDDFQQAYFGIWLSEHSVGESFTNSLIGI